MIPIDGQSVHPATGAAYWNLAAAFRTATGKELRVTSGHRTTAEQTALFLSRYRLQATGGGTYGDIRWWQGRRYVRVSAAGTVAVPGTSLHESLRALDVRDTGADAGVTVAGTVRANWLRANAPRFQFNPRGYNFGEPWHIEYTGSLTVPAGGGGTPTPTPKPKVEDDMEFRYFSRTNPATKKAQWAITHPLYFTDGVYVTDDITLADGFAPYAGNSMSLNEAGRWDGMLKTAKLAHDAAWAAEERRAALASTATFDYEKLSNMLALAVAAIAPEHTPKQIAQAVRAEIIRD